MSRGVVVILVLLGGQWMGLMDSRCYSVDWVGIYTTIARIANFEK